jgi:hypothetical protein
MCLLCDAITRIILYDRDIRPEEREPHTWIRHVIGTWDVISRQIACVRISSLAQLLRLAAQVELMPEDTLNLQKHTGDDRNRWYFDAGKSKVCLNSNTSYQAIV